MFSKVILASLLLTMFVSVCSATVLSGAWVQQYALNPGNTIPGINDSQYWPEAVREVGGSNGVLDVVVDCAQTWMVNGSSVYWGYMAFPGVQTNYTYYASTDLRKPIIDAAISNGGRVILNIQPEQEDPVTVINQVLTQYAAECDSIIGVAVDLEFVRNSNSQHCNNTQRDAWMAAMKSHLPNGKLYLITYQNASYLPNDTPDQVIMYDGDNAPNSYILQTYSALTTNYSECGLYTGYPGNTPNRVANISDVMTAQPKTVLVDRADFDISQGPTTPLNWGLNVAPTVDFTSNLTSGTYPVSVAFSSSITNATSWSWDFGDGNTSTDQNPIHTYTTAGIYTVNLTASNIWGTGSKKAIISVQTPPAPQLPIANFTSNKMSGYAPLNVQFIDLSQNTTSMNWSFGDGATSTSRNPAHTYTSAGIYTVALTATNAAGSNTTTKTNYINAILKRGGGE